MSSVSPRPLVPVNPYPVRSPIIVAVLSRSLGPVLGESLIRQSLKALLRGLRDQFGDAIRLMIGGGGAGDRVAALVAGTVGVPRIDVVGGIGAASIPGAPVAELQVDLTTRAPCNGSGSLVERWQATIGLLMSSAHIIVTIGDERPCGGADRLLGTAWTPEDFPYYLASADPLRRLRKTSVGALDIGIPVPWLQITGQEIHPNGSAQVSACVRHRRGASTTHVLLQDKSELRDLLPPQTTEALGEIQRLNSHIAGIKHRIDRINFRSQVEAISVSAVPRPKTLHETAFDRLGNLQAGVDTIAQGFQRWMLGVGTPAIGFKDWCGQVYRNYRKGGWLPSVSVLVSFCLLVPLVVALFEVYAHPPKFLPFHKYAHHLLLGYILLFFTGFVVYLRIVKQRRWQDHFQDYRAYAEALRVQIFWSLAGIERPVGDHYLFKHRAELGWIRYALRGSVPWSRTIAATTHHPPRRMICEGWIIDQREYFHKAAHRNHRSATRSRRYILSLLLTGVAVAAVLFSAEVMVHGFLPGELPAGKQRLLNFFASFGMAEKHVKDLRYLAIITMGMMPALAAYFGLSSEMRAFEGHAQGYRLMSRIFARAMDAEATTAVDDEAFRNLVFELGREAINENAGWLMDHRHRPIENRMG